MKLSLRGCRIGVVGLGYVGLPLAVEFGKHFDTVGFDIKTARIAELKAGKDSTLECSTAELQGRQQAEVLLEAQGPRAMPAFSSSPCRRPSTSTTGRT